jgi:hypothetical protein
MVLLVSMSAMLLSGGCHAIENEGNHHAGF